MRYGPGGATEAGAGFGAGKQTTDYECGELSIDKKILIIEFY